VENGTQHQHTWQPTIVQSARKDDVTPFGPSNQSQSTNRIFDATVTVASIARSLFAASSARAPLSRPQPSSTRSIPPWQRNSKTAAKVEHEWDDSESESENVAPPPKIIDKLQCRLQLMFMNDRGLTEQTLTTERGCLRVACSRMVIHNNDGFNVDIAHRGRKGPSLHQHDT
jgi:hypothetical protein